MFYKACLEELSLTSSSLSNHIKSTKHQDGKLKVNWNGKKNDKSVYLVMQCTEKHFYNSIIHNCWVVMPLSCEQEFAVGFAERHRNTSSQAGSIKMEYIAYRYKHSKFIVVAETML